MQARARASSSSAAGRFSRRSRPIAASTCGTFVNGRTVSASSTNEVIRVARDYIGEYLQVAQRGGVPWGLRVTVSGGVAVYWESSPSRAGPSSCSPTCT
jgi:hypothetical protein